MSAETLVVRLQGVKTTGPNRWLARCPAHDDRMPSLSVTERDGRVLIHCFGGCETEDVLGAVGLRFPDIMPERLDNEARHSAPIPALQVLEAVAHEIMVAAMLAQELGYAASCERLVVAGSRLNAALTLIGHEPASLKAQRRAQR